MGQPPGQALVGASGPAPAPGFPCSSDADVACAFGHCTNGRCGGCASSNDCKPGAACTWTVMGMACLPALPAPPQPAPAPPPGSGGPPSTPPSPAPGAGDPFAHARQSCADETNRYRATLRLPPLAVRAQAFACGDDEARGDAQANRAHASFGKCQQSAQNECPGWPGPADSVVAPCIKMMFDEGPGQPYSAHGHYINMTSTSYTQVACGFSQGADGSVWMVEDFF